MPRLRSLVVMTLVAAIALPAVAGAQDDGDVTMIPASPAARPDTRLSELEALVPEVLAGLPLRENMRAAPGELLASRMDDDVRAALEAMLEANGKSIADYAAANVPISIDDSIVVVIQPHRVTGIDAAATLDDWGAILALDARRPAIDETIIAGQDVILVSDGARPDIPVLHLFASGDVVWMIVARDEAVVEEAVRTLSAPMDLQAAE
jgi:hypothetical protein